MLDLYLSHQRDRSRVHVFFATSTMGLTSSLNTGTRGIRTVTA